LSFSCVAPNQLTKQTQTLTQTTNNKQQNTFYKSKKTEHTTMTTSSTSFQSMRSSSVQENWMKSLFCGCSSAAQPWETFPASMSYPYEEEDCHHLVETASKDVVIIWGKHGKPHKQTSNTTNSEVLLELRSSPPSMSDDTCTTATMGTISFDTWEDDDDDDDDDDSIVALNAIPDLALSARVFSNDTGCSFASFYASPALAHDEGEDDVNSLTSEEEVEDPSLRL
jgi:hypothetical protein